MACVSIQEGTVVNYKEALNILGEIEKRAVLVRVSGNVLRNGKELPERYRIKFYSEYWLKYSKRSFNDSGLFSTADVVYDDKKTDDSDHDVTADIQYEINQHGLLYESCVHLMTLCFLPHKETTQINIKITFINNRNSRTATYDRLQKVITWHQLFAFILVPFTELSEWKEEGNMLGTIYYKACTDIIKQAYLEGVL